MIDSPIIAAFVRSALVPTLVAMAVFFFTGFLKDPWKTRLQALSMALAFIAGAFALIGRLQFPPSDASEGFSWAAVLLAGFVFISPRSLMVRYWVRALFVLVLGFVVFWPLKQSLANPIHYRNLLAFFCLALGVWSIVEKSSSRVSTLTLIVLPLISATSLSLILLFAGSASYSQLVTILCALLGGSAALALIAAKRVSVMALIPFLSVFVILLMAAGHFYLEINPWHMIYLCFPYLILWIRPWLSFIPKAPVLEAGLLALISALPLAYFVYTIGINAGPLY